ncbi:MAG TPA: hypothetical protein VFM90_08590, partial [Cyclobacteriaceae bacterium]|nr:hypothetical protein [Cyclobacteriaceae bacterium]
VFLVDYLLGLTVPGAHDHLAEYGCLVFFFALVSVTVVYCSKVLVRLFDDIQLFIEHDTAELHKAYEEKLKLSYAGFIPVVFAVLFSIVVNVTVGDAIRQFTPEGTAVYYLRMAYVYAGFFFLGLGIWALVNVIFIPIRLTKYKIRVSVNQIPGRGLQALGASYFNMSLAITITFVPLVVAAIISPLITDVSILIWLGLGTVSIFGFFLLPQIGIHNIMAREKQQRLLSFSNHLETSLERSLKDPTPENLQHLKELFELQAHLKNMNEWPFNVNTVWQLITALLIPITLALIEVFFNR